MDKQKTEEGASSRASIRNSRLLQPRKYSATPHMRSSSSENRVPHCPPPSKRSRSVCMDTQTPSRTPMGRSLGLAYTPASMHTDKKILNEQSTRVLQVLRKHFGNKFLLGGLRTMSAKQFVEIIQYLAQTICGNKMQIHENNVEDVKRFVQFVGYPQIMNKSWFKTPTVPVAYDRIVELLDWLCDLISIDETENIEKIFEKDDVMANSANVFPNEKFIETFVSDAKYNFLLWSDQKPQFAEVKTKLTESFIFEKTQLNDITAHIMREKSDYEMLANNRIEFDNENRLLAQKNNCVQLTKEVNQLKQAIDEQKVEFQETSRELKSSTAANTVFKKKIAELQHIINNQTITPENRQQIIYDLEQKTLYANEKQSMIDSLQSTASGHQVKIARLKMQNVSTIFSFNNLIQKLFEVGEWADFDGITREHLTIQENDSIDRIKEVLQLFAGIKEAIAKRRQDVQASSTKSELKLTAAKNELFNVEDEWNTWKKNVHSLEIQIRKVENDTVDNKYSSEQQQKQIQTKIDAILEICTQNNSKIEHAEKLTNALDEENAKILQGIEMKGTQLLRAKQIRLARITTALSDLENVAEKLNSTVNNLK